MSKLSKKQSKKLVKFSQSLQQNEGIRVSDEATKIVCVRNAGLDNGVSQEEVLELFQPFGAIEAVILLPQRPYAFVCYSSEAEAQAALNGLNGTILRPHADPKQGLQLLVVHVNKAPASMVPDSTLPPGLVVVEDFVSSQTEELLLQCLDWKEEKDDETQRTLKHRRVRHFGYEFKYGANNVDPRTPLSEGIPECCREFLTRALDRGLVQHFPDQLTVNQYLPGQGIPPHVDTPSAFEDGIMSLSLGAAVVMEFRNPLMEQHLSVLLPARSLLVMTGESRFVWTHGISPRKSDIVPTPDGSLTLLKRATRTSFTFRKLSATAGVLPCNAEKQSLRPSLPMSEEEAKELEEKHVHQVYNEIADHFSGTRHTPWPQIAEFLLSQEPGSLLADMGCGNGKYLHVNPHLFPIASDRSDQLCAIVQQRSFQVFVGDVLHLPLRSAVFDVVLCIAVIHHLSTPERRRAALVELVRLLRTGGQALVYVWAKEQERQQVRSKYLQGRRHDGSADCLQDCDTHTGHAGSTDCLCTEEDCDTHKSGHTGSNAASAGLQLSSALETVTLQDSGREKSSSERAPDTSRTGFPGEVCDSEEPPSRREFQAGRTRCSCSLNSSAPGSEGLQPCPRGDGNAGEPDILDTRVSLQDVSDLDSPQPTLAGSSGIHADETAVNRAYVCSEEQRQPLPVHKNRTAFQQQDMLVPWTLKGRQKQASSSAADVHLRFYHVFQAGELEALCETVPGCSVVKSYYDQGNWCVVLEKNAPY